MDLVKHSKPLRDALRQLGVEFGIAQAKSLQVHAAGLANGKRKLQPFQVEEKATAMAAEEAEEQREQAARLAQASVVSPTAAKCSNCGGVDGESNGKGGLGNGRAYTTVNVRARRPYVHDGSPAPAFPGVTKLLCEQCMWRCSRCACHEYAGFCMRHRAFSDAELLPCLKLTTGDNARKMKVRRCLSENEEASPLQVVDRCGCCTLSRQEEYSRRHKKGWLVLEDRPGSTFRLAMVSKTYLSKVRSKPPSYQSGSRNYRTLNAATRVSVCRLATFTQLPARVAQPAASGWTKGHARRLGFEGRADHLKSVLIYIKRNGLHVEQQHADGAPP